MLTLQNNTLKAYFLRQKGKIAKNVKSLKTFNLNSISISQSDTAEFLYIYILWKTIEEPGCFCSICPATSEINKGIICGQ